MYQYTTYMQQIGIQQLSTKGDPFALPVDIPLDEDSLDPDPTPLEDLPLKV